MDEKIPLILHPLLLSADITLGFFLNHHFPPSRSAGFLEEIKSYLLNTEERAIVFDIRVKDWSDFQHLSQARELARALQDICSLRHISSSVFLISGSQQLGNLVGLPFEIFEAREVLEGKGPPDLFKFALEIGSDFLLLTKKTQHKMEANILLKEKIVSGEVSSLAEEILPTPFTCFDTESKIRICSSKAGYMHHWIPEELLAMRDKFSSLPGCGFALLKKHGDKVKKGDGTAEVFLLKDQKKIWPYDDFERTFFISTDPPDFRPFILERPEMRLF